MPSTTDNVGCLVSLDPGTESLGVARFYVELPSLKIVSCAAQTFKGSKLNFSDWVVENHSAQFARIKAHQENLLSYLKAYTPFMVVSEAPFFSRKFPMAFAALVRLVSAIDQAVYQYDKALKLHTIDPPTVKLAVGAPGNAGKLQMHLAVMDLKDLNYDGDIPIGILDEHAIDALAVGYCKIKQLLNLEGLKS